MIVELSKEERNRRDQDSPLMCAPPCSGHQGINLTKIVCYKTRKEDVIFDGAFGGVGDEEVVVGEGMVVISSSLDMLTNSCLGGIMVSLIFLEWLDKEAFVEFMVE
ncbi:hypothetical protein Tco_0658789 [Tanacetum coccineum]